MDIKELLRIHIKDKGFEKFPVEGDIWLVPCSANYAENNFLPLLKPLSVETVRGDHSLISGWSIDEDEMLKKSVLARGAKSWSLIAKEINIFFHNRNSIRTGKVCKERWINHLNPNLKKEKWTEEEDKLLMSLQKQLGSHWSQISKQIPGRTENNVRNRFKTLANKFNISNSQAMDTIESFQSKNESIITPEHDFSNLMSPKIVSIDVSEKFFDQQTTNNIGRVPVVVRPIGSRPPSTKAISQTKTNLKASLIDTTPSPSTFFKS